MSIASLETTLDLWASSLRAVKDRMRPVFKQDRVAASAYAFLDGLPGPERRKTGWMRAEAAGDKGPPCWQRSPIMRTASRPKKHRCRRYRSRTSPHRLVNPGNPPHRHAACATAHQSCPYHCLVALAAGSSGRRKALASEMENATVVLGLICKRLHPKQDHADLDHGQIVVATLFITSGDAPCLLEAVD